MMIRDRIRELSNLPPRFNTMLEQGLVGIEDRTQRKDLCEVACVVSNEVWERWLSLRKPEDNRKEHEWVVFANVMKIAEAEDLCLSDRRIATAFCFLHDTYSIKRIMDEEIRELERVGRTKEAEQKSIRKKNQRIEHMEGGAENTRTLLNELKYPASKAGARDLFHEQEIKRCVDIVSKHDSWKVDPPESPPTRDRLRLACLEGDALWPLHPLGVLADLERPNGKGETKDFSDPATWHAQLQQSNKTLVEYRSKWKGIPASAFIDSNSIFRTREGWRLYDEWRRRWSLRGST